MELNIVGDTHVGILVNRDYMPSVLAGDYIRAVLQKAGTKTNLLALSDVVNHNIRDNVVINVYYGELGDGGIVSGMLEEQKVPFVGNSQYSCALMYNKVASKLLFQNKGYATPTFWYSPSAKKQDLDLYHEIIKEVSLPMLAKTVTGAASENLCLIHKEEELVAFVKDHRELIDSGYYFFEQFIKGIELTAGYINVLGKLLPVVEIELAETVIQSHVVKFSHGLKNNILPARINEVDYLSVQYIAKEVHELFKCRVFSRTDIIYEESSKTIYLLESNSNPGLLENSLLPLMSKASGTSNLNLLQRLIMAAF